MLGTGCGYLQVPFFMHTSGFTVLWHLARKLIPMENTSSELNLKTDYGTFLAVTQGTYKQPIVFNSMN